MTEPNCVARLHFANEYLAKTDDQWKKTIFVDEKVFTTNKDGRYGVWRPDNTRYDASYVLPQKHSGRHTKGYSGCVSGYGPGELIDVGRRMNAARYLQILRTMLLPFVEEQFDDEAVIDVVEDNSAVHTARIIREWYNDQPRLRRLIWPPRSPDLNIIENVWAEMVREWAPSMARTEDQLHERVIEAWRDLQNRQEYFTSLTNSMRRRIQKVIDAQGGYINY